MIIRSVKSAIIPEQLNLMKKIANKLNINSIEIHELYELNKTIPLKKRIKILLDSGFKRIYFHYVLPISLYDYELVFPFDLTKTKIQKKGNKYKVNENLIFKLTKETIKAAGIIGSKLSLDEVPIIIHFLGVSRKVNLNLRRFYLWKANLIQEKLNEYAKEISLMYSTNIILCRENNPPQVGKVNSLIDFDFKDMFQEINQSNQKKVKNSIQKKLSTFNRYLTFDISHLWLYYLYSKQNKNEFKGASLSLKDNNGFSLEDNLKLISQHAKVLHMSDAGPSYFSKDEGKVIGTGNVDFEMIFDFLKKSFKSKTIYGTYEIKDQHINPDYIIESEKTLKQFNFFKEIFI